VVAAPVSAPVPKASLVVKKAEPEERIEALIAALDDAPTIKANLELGDFVEKPCFHDDVLHLTVGFPEDEGMPKDYLQDPDVAPKFRARVAQFYGVNEAKLVVKLVTVTIDEALKSGFTTVHQRDSKRQADDVESRRGKILNAPYVKEAERLFNAKVDKVILKDSKL